MRYTTLVNENNPWKVSYEKYRSLIQTKNIYEEEVQIEKETFEQFEKLKESLKEVNIEIGLKKAYEEDYFSDFITGLSLEFSLLLNGEYVTEEDDSNTSIFTEIRNQLPRFGFINRMISNPFHIRYVGKVPAKVMCEEHLTLEEYLEDFGCVIAVNKPKDITSFDVVNEISHTFGIKRVGHTGTLDPLATGVLLVTVGKATKIVELLTAKDKEYEATVEIGYKTDTYDNTGKVLDRCEIREISNLEEILKSFEKTYLQEVPIYSAVKVNGKKLYQYARENKEVELPKKEVTIKKIELIEQKEKSFVFRSLVSKGCYIRSLIQDIGKSLNTYLTMTDLVRTKQGSIFIETTNTLEEVKSGKAILRKIEDVLDLPIIMVEPGLEFKIRNGVKIQDEWNITDKVIFKNLEDKVLGIYQKEGEILKTWKVFVNE